MPTLIQKKPTINTPNNANQNKDACVSLDVQNAIGLLETGLQDTRLFSSMVAKIPPADQGWKYLTNAVVSRLDSESISPGERNFLQEVLLRHAVARTETLPNPGVDIIGGVDDILKCLLYAYKEESGASRLSGEHDDLEEALSNIDPNTSPRVILGVVSKFLAIWEFYSDPSDQWDLYLIIPNIVRPPTASGGSRISFSSTVEGAVALQKLCHEQQNPVVGRRLLESIRVDRADFQKLEDFILPLFAGLRKHKIEIADEFLSSFWVHWVRGYSEGLDRKPIGPTSLINIWESHHRLLQRLLDVVPAPRRPDILGAHHQKVATKLAALAGQTSRSAKVSLESGNMGGRMKRKAVEEPLPPPASKRSRVATTTSAKTAEPLARAPKKTSTITRSAKLTAGGGLACK
ncbi:hypothetical protein SISSUDRAFT_1048510 [Sistotremastrum suecicum HHB10207 ss-3]|uniref:Uncharacterized protein n=1 Tax=Sistotremastrum suecicum HHB10207 ss-3 TaxID=1314776 RepID=A0A166CFX8_9AGAM|nr:hypothetical protein SISSUDRAFT_1048510 [Sistotremastrum suecicum HHB10207 ss-3]